ncbi:MAG: nitrate reductase [Betaproteobacteria bacterium]|nr:nitrate reductase [Betaproteobacteria bacterium]
MDMLAFARGPGLHWSLTILFVGVFWRLTGILLLRRSPDYSVARISGWWTGALRLIALRSWPRREFSATTSFPTLIGYLFHIGLAVIVFGLQQHILLIRSLTGLSWPNLPSGLVNLTAGVTAASMLALLIRRMTNPVLRLLSNFDDYFSWLVAFLPVATGMLAVAHLGARYETLLALHMLSAELLFVWFPFGKLMHASLIFLSRGTSGALLTRKGAAI